MKRMIQGLLTVSLLVVLQAVPARADVTVVDPLTVGVRCAGISPNGECGPNQPVFVQQGKTVSLRVIGQDVNFARKNDLDVTGSGVTASITKDHLVAPGYGLGTGAADAQLIVGANAAAGERTVTLKHDCFGCTTPRRYNFKIRVVRDGTITGVTGTEPDDFFQEVNLTFNGQRLGEAGVNIINNPDGATAQIIENTESRIVLRLSFTEVKAEAEARLLFFDKNCVPGGNPPVPCAQYDGLPNNGEITIRSKDNFVQAIEFPNGTNVTQGSLLTFRIKLARPARGSFLKHRIVPDLRSLGELVKWSLANRNLFEAVPGSGTVFDPNIEQNSVRIPPGDQLVTLSVRLRQAPAGCALQQGCSGQIITRMINFNTDQSPFRKDASFTMFPPN